MEYHASRLDKKKATRWAMFGLWPLLDVSEAGDLTLEECLSHGMTEKLFRQIDADNNGSLSKEEFAEWKKLSGK